MYVYLICNFASEYYLKFLMICTSCFFFKVEHASFIPYLVPIESLLNRKQSHIFVHCVGDENDLEDCYTQDITDIIMHQYRYLWNSGQKEFPHTKLSCINNTGRIHKCDFESGACGISVGEWYVNSGKTHSVNTGKSQKW